MQFQEVVEAEGHLIDSHIVENIFDKVVQYNGRFEVQEENRSVQAIEPAVARHVQIRNQAIELARDVFRHQGLRSVESATR